MDFEKQDLNTIDVDAERIKLVDEQIRLEQAGKAYQDEAGAENTAGKIMRLKRAILTNEGYYRRVMDDAIQLAKKGKADNLIVSEAEEVVKRIDRFKEELTEAEARLVQENAMRIDHLPNRDMADPFPFRDRMSD